MAEKPAAAKRPRTSVLVTVKKKICIYKMQPPEGNTGGDQDNHAEGRRSRHRAYDLRSSSWSYILSSALRHFLNS